LCIAATHIHFYLLGVMQLLDVEFSPSDVGGMEEEIQRITTQAKPYQPSVQRVTLLQLGGGGSRQPAPAVGTVCLCLFGFRGYACVCVSVCFIVTSIDRLINVIPLSVASFLLSPGFTLSLDNRSTALLPLASSPAVVQAALWDVASAKCVYLDAAGNAHPTDVDAADGSRQDHILDTFEGGPAWYGWGGRSPKRVGDTAFCGHFSTYVPYQSIARWGRGNTNMFMDVIKFPWVCMAYRIPPTTTDFKFSFLTMNYWWAKIPIVSKAIPWGWQVTKDDQWHHGCYNLKQYVGLLVLLQRRFYLFYPAFQIENFRGFKKTNDNRIHVVAITNGAPGRVENPMWLDEISFSSKPRRGSYYWLPLLTFI
jgi:hypothetical protein